MNFSAARTWYAVSAVMAVLVVIAGWFLLVAPQRSQASDTVDETSQVNAKNDETRVDIVKLEGQKDEIGALKLKIATIQTQVPSRPSLPALIRSLSSSAKLVGVSLTSMTPSTPTLLVPSATGGTNSGATPGQVSQIPIALQLTGNFSNIRLYLNQLETLRRSLLVTQFKIDRVAKTGLSSTTSSTSTDGTGSLKLSISATAFFATPGTPLATPTTAPVAPNAS